MLGESPLDIDEMKGAPLFYLWFLSVSVFERMYRNVLNDILITLVLKPTITEI